MVLKLVQVGDPILRQRARPLAPEEVRSTKIQQLIFDMRETMRQAPGVGLAAPQIGESLQLAVIEDRAEYMQNADAQALARLGRSPVPFHVLVNPTLTVTSRDEAEFFEGCLSFAGFLGLVTRALSVHVDALDERGEPVALDGTGWYARILQHEIDHLNGVLCVDRMCMRSLTNAENHRAHWAGVDIEQVRRSIDAPRTPTDR